MPFTLTEFRATPNPNALMCMVEPSPLDPRRPSPRSYPAADQLDPDADPLAAALFDVPGVRSLLIHERFITVNKSEEARWPTIRRAVRRVLAAAETPGP